jgi:hypothetical protein
VRIANVLRQLAFLALILIASNSRVVLAQTPSPLQEWQYSGGIILARLFQPDLPKWRTVLGVASEVQPPYEGARAYRVQGGPVINIHYRDVAFFAVGEGLGYNFLRGDHYQVGLGVTAYFTPCRAGVSRHASPTFRDYAGPEFHGMPVQDFTPRRSRLR